MIEESFNEMQVRQVINCENRSLDTTPGCCEEKTSDRIVVGLPSQNPDEFPVFTRALEELYKMLVGKVMPFITQDEVVIIPDGQLYKVPFAALRDPDTGRYLSETKRIRFAPSLLTLKLLQEYPVDFQNQTGSLIIGSHL